MRKFLVLILLSLSCQLFGVDYYPFYCRMSFENGVLKVVNDESYYGVDIRCEFVDITNMGTVLDIKLKRTRDFDNVVTQIDISKYLPAILRIGDTDFFVSNEYQKSIWAMANIVDIQAPWYNFFSKDERIDALVNVDTYKHDENKYFILIYYFSNGTKIGFEKQIVYYSPKTKKFATEDYPTGCIAKNIGGYLAVSLEGIFKYYKGFASKDIMTRIKLK